MTIPEEPRPQPPLPPASGVTPPATPGGARTQRDRALDALHKMAKPKPRPTEHSGTEDCSSHEGVGVGATGGMPVGNPGSGAGSATGFVGMLAKRQLDSSDSHAPAEGDGPRKHTPPLAMAREIIPEDGIEVSDAESEDVAAATDEEKVWEGARDLIAAKDFAPQAPASEWKPRESTWYHVAFPIAITLTCLLVGIGIWAVGALYYMHSVVPDSPADVHYPLLSWSYDVGDNGGYTPGSRVMALGMLVCFPVAFLLIILTMMFRRRMQIIRTKLRYPL